MTSRIGLMLLLASMAGVPARAAGVTVRQSGQAFDQRSIVVHQGDHVTITNQDDVKHNILVQSGEDDEDEGRDMGLQAPGQVIDVVFDKAGQFRVRCHIHPDMRLNVTVK